MDEVTIIRLGGLALWVIFLPLSLWGLLSNPPERTALHNLAAIFAFMHLFLVPTIAIVVIFGN